MAESIQFSLLDIHFADFIVRIDRHPSNGLWWGAALTSYCARRGHTCFNLSDPLDAASFPSLRTPRTSPPSDSSHWRGILETSDTVGAPGAFTPLVLDSSGRLYLHRCWRYEQQVAAGITSRSMPPAVDENRLESLLDRYFPVRNGSVDLQRSAARMALTRRFSVISGGPGTGKTATVARILVLLLEIAGDTPPKIMLAAPTGKAALRLHQSILHAAGRLDIPEEIRGHLPAEVSTIHRLLGVQARTGGFRHRRDNRLPCDILVVDEASMVDLPLMSALMEALRDDARIILLGDRNQLASVESGAVLADICDSMEQGAVPVTQLTRSYRFADDSGIAALSRLITGGESTAAEALLTSGRFPDIIWRSLPSGKAFEAAFNAAVREGYGPYLRAASPVEALAELASFRVLSPLRSGPQGVENLNRLCREAVAPEKKEARTSGMMPVMITGNNYELGLFNGDTGVVMESDGTRAVWFENPAGGIRHLSLLRLPPFEAAFALTAHKSQGSEFGRVLLILPDQMSEVLSRELLYTAVTRARSSLEIWCTAEVFRHAVERRTLRTSGLSELLASGGQHV